MNKKIIDNTKEFEEFAKNNGFSGCFRTSAKTGKNIDEAMKYLIDNIIRRFEFIQTKGGGDIFKEKRKNFTLEPDEKNETSIKRTKWKNILHSYFDY